MANDWTARLTVLRLLLAILALCPGLMAQAQTLNSYYVHYCTGSSCAELPSSISTANEKLPLVARRFELTMQLPFTGYETAVLASIPRGSVFSDEGPYIKFSYLSAEGQNGAICEPLPRPTALNAGAAATRAGRWDELVGAGLYNCGGEYFPGQFQSTGSWVFTDRFTFGAPIRRKAADGSEFEASPLVQTREGRPWLTMYWGYKLGLVESQFDWNAAELSQLPAFANWPRYAPKSEEFVLLRLPPPIIEGTVTEYVNTADYPTHPGGVYFYATTDEDRRILDAQLPGKFVRTGKSFKHGGYVSVCRFYGSTSPGPNTHFYTASFDECELIKSLEVKPRPLDRQQLNYEGKVFYANLPIPPATAGAPATCPAASVPLYRAYNAAFGPQGKRNYDSNHRFSTDRADIDEVVQKGWVDEGLVMCVPQ